MLNVLRFDGTFLFLVSSFSCLLRTSQKFFDVGAAAMRLHVIKEFIVYVLRVLYKLIWGVVGGGRMV